MNNNKINQIIEKLQKNSRFRNIVKDIANNRSPNNRNRTSYGNTKRRFFPKPSNVYRRARNTVYGASRRLQNATGAARRYIPKGLETGGRVAANVLKAGTHVASQGIQTAALLAAMR
jgi:hypothetical protein